MKLRTITTLALVAGLSLTGCGKDNPMQSETVSPLGKPASKVANPRAVVVVTLTQNGSAVSGATVALSRSVAGQGANYLWSGTTDAQGKTSIDITAASGNANGYYLIRATHTSGATLGQWHSVPLSGGYEQLVTLPVGGRALVASGASLAPKTAFTVRIENVTPTFAFAESGVFNIPEGATSPGPAFSGNAFVFGFNAAPGSRLSFATMFAQSNDWFFAPGEAGIALWDANGNQISGDVTSQIQLWDSGTEADQEPGAGSNQAPRQSAPNTGPVDPNNTVRLASGFSNIPTVASMINVTVTPTSATGFTVRIENISTVNTLTSSAGPQPVPVSPGVYVIHTDNAPLFTVGQADRSQGLEGIAEDGNPTALGESIRFRTGFASPFSPGVFVLHTESSVLFKSGQPDFGQGLERIAEEGDPTNLSGALAARFGSNAGVFNIPVGASGPGPIVPGGAYSFTISAEAGSHLSFASMLGQSNDWFFAPGNNGIPLWNASGTPVSGDVSSQISLWDAGTEIDQPLGIGADQGPRQSAPNTGAADPNNAVRVVSDPSGRTPAANRVIRVTITPQR